VQLCAGSAPWLAPLCDDMGSGTWGLAPNKLRLSHVVVYNSLLVGKRAGRGGGGVARGVCGAKPNRRLNVEPKWKK
jgi:hypothetical protein